MDTASNGYYIMGNTTNNKINTSYTVDCRTFISYAEAVGTLVAHPLTEYSTQNLGEMEEMEQQLVLIQNLCYCSVFHSVMPFFSIISILIISQA